MSFGAVKGDGVVDLGACSAGASDARRASSRRRAAPRDVARRDEQATIALEEMRYLPTVPDAEKIICIGINYGGRNEEYKDGAEPPKYPSVFMRTPGSLVGHGEPIVRPPESEQLDYEGEIVLVIGRRGRRIAEADAWSTSPGSR